MNCGAYYGDLISQKHKGRKPVAMIRSNLSIMGEENFSIMPRLYRSMAEACTRKNDANTILHEYRNILVPILEDNMNNDKDTKDTWKGTLLHWCKDPEENPMEHITAQTLIPFAPIGLVKNNIYETKKLAREIAKVQFKDPKSQYAAEIFVAVIYLLSCGYSKKDAYNYICSKLGNLPREIVELRSSFFYSDDAYHALIAAIVSLYDSDHSIIAIKNALTLGGNVSANCILTAIFVELSYGLEKTTEENVRKLMTTEDFFILDNFKRKSLSARYRNGKRMRQFVKTYFPESIWN